MAYARPFFRHYSKEIMNFRLNYVVILGIVALILGAGTLIAMQGMDWYNNELVLSPIIPPVWVFKVVWSFIGFFTALSIMIVWNTFRKDVVFWLALVLFGINGILNVSWSYVFFVRHEIGNAYWIAASIQGTVVLLMVLLWSRSRAAALLLLPYALWLIFALYLNNDTWLINEAL